MNRARYRAAAAAAALSVCFLFSVTAFGASSENTESYYYIYGEEDAAETEADAASASSTVSALSAVSTDSAEETAGQASQGTDASDAGITAKDVRYDADANRQFITVEDRDGNLFYCGHLSDGSTSEALVSLRIRSDETYAQICNILEQRKNSNEEKRHIAMQTKGQAMLSGNIYCAHCGGRLTTIHYRDKYERADGSVVRTDVIKYSCYHKSRKLCECDGQTTYRADVVDERVTEAMRRIFSCMDGAPEEEKLQLMLKQQLAGNRASQTKLGVQLEKDRAQVKTLQDEIGKALAGNSLFTAEDLTEAIRSTKERITEAEAKLEELRIEEINKKESAAAITPEYNRFKSWAEEFDAASLEEKKMIACNLFTRIEVGRGYTIKAVLNMTYQQFCSEWTDGNLLEMEKAI